jgi:hypothetical protein
MFWLRLAVKKKHMDAFHVPTTEMIADILTKSLTREKVLKLRTLMGLGWWERLNHGGVLMDDAGAFHLDG